MARLCKWLRRVVLALAAPNKIVVDVSAFGTEVQFATMMTLDGTE